MKNFFFKGLLVLALFLQSLIQLRAQCPQADLNNYAFRSIPGQPYCDNAQIGIEILNILINNTWYSNFTLYGPNDPNRFVSTISNVHNLDPEVFFSNLSTSSSNETWRIHIDEYSFGSHYCNDYYINIGYNLPSCFDFTLTPTLSPCNSGSLTVNLNSNVYNGTIHISSAETGYSNDYSFGNPGISSYTFNGVPQGGNYNVTVNALLATTCLHCSPSHSVSLPAFPFSTDFNTFATNTITGCSNGSDGNIYVNILNNSNAAYYDITISKLSDSSLFTSHLGITSTSQIFNNIPPGDYIVGVYEHRSGGCYKAVFKNVTISPPSSVYFSPTVTSADISTSGCGNGKINIVLPNDHDNYFTNFWSDSWQSRYTAYLYNNQWSLISSIQGYDTIQFAHQPAGTYNLVIIGQRFDAQLCPSPFVQTGITLTEQPCALNLNALATPPSHLNCTDGLITVSMQNYSIDCSPHIDLYNSTDSLVGHWIPDSGSLPYAFKNLAAENYHVVAGSGSCSTDTIVTINDGPCNIQFNVSATQGIHGCNANKLTTVYTGSICGTLNFNYQNNDAPFNTGIFTSGDNINFTTNNNLPPGHYTITGSSGSCTASQDFLINDGPCTLNATANTVNSGTCTASIYGTVSNFCTSLTIQLRRLSDDSLYNSISSSDSNYRFDALGNGSYKIVVTDAGGCTITKTAAISGLTCTPPTGGSYTAIASRKGTVSWNLSNCATAAVGYTVQYRVQGTSGWSAKQVTTNTNSVVLTNLQTNTAYECRIRTKCVSNTLSVFGPIFTFNTNGSLSAGYSPEALKSATIDDDEIKAIPNPTTGKVTILFNTGKPGKYSIDITNTNGKLLQHNTFNAIKGENETRLDLSNFTAGLYLIVLKNDEQQSRSVKLIKL